MFARRVLCLATIALSLVTASLARGETPWKRHVVHEGTHTATVVAGEMTGDRQIDVIGPASGKVRLFVAPDWREIILAEGDGYDFIHSELFDVDGDGDLDWIGARYQPGWIVWLEQPDNPLTDSWQLRLVDDQVNGIHGLLKADIDRDDRFDLIANSAQPLPPLPDSAAWYKIPENVRAAPRWERHVFADQDAPGLSHYFGAGDINGDGRVDISLAAKGGPQAVPGMGEWFAWWEAPADPHQVWKKHSIADRQPGATNIHPADVNGDGQMDFIATRGHDRGVIWFEGPAWREHAIHETLLEPHSLVVVNMDDDGDVDAATCAYGDRLALWFENDGHGKFTTHLVAEDQAAYDIRAIDMDADSDLDLLIAGQASLNVAWYENPRLASGVNWIKVTDQAGWQPRDSAAELVFQDRLWIMGGWFDSYEAPPRDVWSSPDGKSWQRVQDAAPWKHSDLPMSLVFDDKMWLLGGWYNGRLPGHSASSGVWWSEDGKQWTAATEQAAWSPRIASGAVVFQGKMWILGGIEDYYFGDQSSLKNDVWCSEDGKNWSCVTTDAGWSPRAYHAAVVHDNKIWIMGGGNYTPQYHALNDVWCSEDGEHWTKVTESAPWHPRIWFSAVTYRDRIWVLGGWSNNPAQNWGDVWYSQDGQDWKQLVTPTAWKERHEHSAYVFQDQIWIAGGHAMPLSSEVWSLKIPHDWFDAIQSDTARPDKTQPDTEQSDTAQPDTDTKQ